MEEERMRGFSAWVIIVVLIGIAAVASQPNLIRSMGFHGGETHMAWSNDGNRFEIRYHGAITISEDDRDITQLTPDGYLILADDRDGGGGRRLEFRSRANGALERKFFVGSHESPYDPGGTIWLGEILPDLVRRTGLAAEARVERILKTQGVAGVLAEISLIRPDYVKRKYFTTLFERARPVGQPLAQAVTQAGQEIRSDYELRELLTTIVHEAIADKEARQAYFDAALTINSDYELASLLIQIGQTHALDASLRVPYFTALETINSDYEHRRVLMHLLERVSDPVIVSAMLESLSSVNSDYETAEFLTALAQHQALDERLSTMYQDAAKRLSSQDERNRALAALPGGEPGRSEPGQGRESR
jgi:hypothetical protein